MKKKFEPKLTKTLLKLKTISLIDAIGISFFFIIIITSALFFLRKADYVTVELRVSEADSLNVWFKPPAWYVDMLSPGLSEKDGLGREVLAIDEVQTYETTEDNKSAYIKMRVRAVYNKRTNQYLYNGVPLLVGSYQTFKLQGIQLMGVVHQIGKEIPEPERKKYLIKGIVDSTSVEHDALAGNTFGSGISAFRADKFVPGIELKDNKNRVIAKLTAVEILPGTRSFAYQGAYYQAPDVNKRIVKVELEVTAEKIGDKYLFKKELPLKVGRSIYIDFPEIDAPVIVTELREQS